MNFNWILINKLAIGTPVNSDKKKLLLNKKGIISILDLRNKYDFRNSKQNKYVKYLKEFEYENVQLPDQNTGRIARTEEITRAVNMLQKLLIKGPVYMHCLASIERSPLISIAYLHLVKKVSLIQSCDYVKQQNDLTNVSLRQLENIKG